MNRSSSIVEISSRAAAVERFYNAQYGMFIHYGLYSILERNEWVQFNEKIPVDDYAKLAEDFSAEKFDANAIAQLAVDAGMRYVNLTTRHHDSFCLWDTKTTDFNSIKASRCGRDLVGELADACREHNLGLCLYFSHGRDWRHPHAPNNDRWGRSARPKYPKPDPHYATGDEHDLQKYVDYVSEQVHELLTGYGPIMAIWFDGLWTPLTPLDHNGEPLENFDPRTDGDVFQVQQLYDMIHELQPGCLVSYKLGYLNTEDFFAPEHNATNRFGETFSSSRPGEVCTTMTPYSWGFDHRLLGKHLTAEQVWNKLAEANKANCNLLLNTGPMPDGSIVPEEAEVLLQVGERLDHSGWPTSIK